MTKKLVAGASLTLLLFVHAFADFAVPKYDNTARTVSTRINKTNLKLCSGLRHAQVLWAQPQLCQLLKTYETAHYKRLQQYDERAKYLLLELDHPQVKTGFGNYANDVVNGFFLSLFLNRTFVYTLPKDMEDNFEDSLRFFYRNFLLAVKHWNPKSRDSLHLANTETLDEQFWKATEYADVLVASPTWGSYVVANFQANPHFAWFLKTYFPDFEVFSPLTQYLFQPKSKVMKTVSDNVQSSFKALNIGIQIRTSKYVIMGWNKHYGMPTTDSYFDLAKAVAARSGLSPNRVTFFIASDTPEVHEEAVAKLPGTVVWTANDVAQNTTKAGNPGTEFSGIVDMKLLSICDVLIITWASSYGYAAAGWGDHAPYVVIPRELLDDAGRPWYYQQVTSEPCHWPANDYMAWDNYRESFQRNPLWMHHSQCHPCVFHSRCRFRTDLEFLGENPDAFEFELYLEYQKLGEAELEALNSTDPVDVDISEERSGQVALLPLVAFFLVFLPGLVIMLYPQCRCALPGLACCCPQTFSPAGQSLKLT